MSVSNQCRTYAYWFSRKATVCFEGIYCLKTFSKKDSKTFPSTDKTIISLSCVSNVHTKNDIVRSFVCRYIDILVMKVKQGMNIGR